MGRAGLDSLSCMLPAAWFVAADLRARPGWSTNGMSQYFAQNEP